MAESSRPAAGRPAPVESSPVVEHQQFVSLFDGIDEVVYVADPETHEILYLNQAGRDRFGNVAGQKCYRTLQNLDQPCPFCTNDLIFGENEGNTHTWEFQNKANDRWYRCIDKAIRWPDGRIVRYEMAIDITEHKQAEEALKESEFRYRAIANLTSDYAYGYRVKPDGKVVNEWVAGTIADITGLSREQIGERRDWSNLVHPDDLPITRKQLETLLAGRPSTVEYRVRAGDDGVRWMRDYAEPVWDETKKRVTHIYGAVKDITEHRQARDLARGQRDLSVALGTAAGLDETLRVCLEAAIDISGMDSGGVYLIDETSGEVNLAFHQGLPPDFVKSASHFPGDSANARLIAVGKPVYARHQELLTAQDATRRGEGLRAIAVIPVLHAGRAVACLNVASHKLRDVPDYSRAALEAIAAQIGSSIMRAKATEELTRHRARLAELVEERTRELIQAQTELVRKAQLAALGQVAGDIAHEVRNALGSMLNATYYLKLTAGDKLEPKPARHLEIIKQEIERTNGIITSLLEYASGRKPLPPRLSDRNRIGNGDSSTDRKQTPEP